MHRCANMEKYCLKLLPTEPFSIKGVIDDFSEIYGPKCTDDSTHNVYKDFQLWMRREGHAPASLTGKRGSRFSWPTRNARWLIMNRKLGKTIFDDFGNLLIDL